MPRADFSEADLYPPVRDLLVGMGFTVRGEVGKCDLAAVRGEELVAVELKKSFNATLLIQATDRQRACDSVYVAIPEPKGGRRGRSWHGFVHLLKRLELGLILVDPTPTTGLASVAFHPIPFERKVLSAKRKALLTEIAGRSGDDTPGGSTKKPRVTAYREQALRLAVLLETGPTSPKDLRARGGSAKATVILRGNPYGWFERLGVGRYGLTTSGRLALTTYTTVADRHRAALAKIQQASP